MPEPGAKWGEIDEIANFLAQPSDFAYISCSTWTLRLLHTGNCSSSTRLAPICIKSHDIYWFACCKVYGPLLCHFSFWLSHHQISWMMRNCTDGNYSYYILCMTQYLVTLNVLAWISCNIKATEDWLCQGHRHMS